MEKCVCVCGGGWGSLWNTNYDVVLKIKHVYNSKEGGVMLLFEAFFVAIKKGRSTK